MDCEKEEEKLPIFLCRVGDRTLCKQLYEVRVEPGVNARKIYGKIWLALMERLYYQKANYA